MSRRRVALAVAAAVLALGGIVLFVPPSGPRSLREFDPDRLAALETDMWRAYYKKEKLRLFSLLVSMLREQYRLPYAKAVGVAFHWARAAATFGDATGDYDRVLPDLAAGYGTLRQFLDAHWDDAEVARAELAWWVARRIPTERSPENVGRLIGELYARIYQAPAARVATAGLLRAQAGWLRDQGGAAADWETVARLLHDSYRSLHDAL